MRILLITMLLLGTVHAQNREALLIGNSQYEHTSRLNNPSSNLKRLKKSLESVGFHVEIKTELQSKAIAEAIEKFTNLLATDRKNIGFFYYTGHGCQVNHEGYLIPTDVNTKKKLDIKYDALNINKMLERFDEAGNSVNMLFLDACRDVPTGTKGGTKGLGNLTDTKKGSLIVYATKAGKTADDNSNFINSLIANIDQPNQNVREMAFNISDAVANKTKGEQIPVVFATWLPKVVLKRGSNVSKWLTPSDSVCTANGGKIDKHGICKANWKNAKKICSASGGRLPTRDELKEVLVDCGGSFATYRDKDWESLMDKNKANSSYQTCYKRKGFFSSSYYWSATIVANNSNDAWIVIFYDGNLYNYNKNSNLYVRCVRAGE